MTIRYISQQSIGKNYDRTTALSILQSPEELINLNPLVISQEIDSNSTYTITDSVPSFLSFLPSMNTTYTATFELTTNGIKSKTLALFGIETVGNWSWIEEEGIIKEEGSIIAPFWIMWYVENQWRSSHKILMNRLEEKLNEISS